MEQKPAWEDVDSSMISAFRYHPDTLTLEVLFNRTGRYTYHAVPAEVVEGLHSASSKGGYMRSVIIDMYRYTKG